MQNRLWTTCLLLAIALPGFQTQQMSVGKPNLAKTLNILCTDLQSGLLGEWQVTMAIPGRGKSDGSSDCNVTVTVTVNKRFLGRRSSDRNSSSFSRTVRAVLASGNTVISLLAILREQCEKQDASKRNSPEFTSVNVKIDFEKEEHEAKFTLQRRTSQCPPSTIIRTCTVTHLVSPVPSDFTLDDSCYATPDENFTTLTTDVFVYFSASPTSLPSEFGKYVTAEKRADKVMVHYTGLASFCDLKKNSLRLAFEADDLREPIAVKFSIRDTKGAVFHEEVLRLAMDLFDKQATLLCPAKHQTVTFNYEKMDVQLVYSTVSYVQHADWKDTVDYNQLEWQQVSRSTAKADSMKVDVWKRSVHFEASMICSALEAREANDVLVAVVYLQCGNCDSPIIFTATVVAGRFPDTVSGVKTVQCDSSTSGMVDVTVSKRPVTQETLGKQYSIRNTFQIANAVRTCVDWQGNTCEEPIELHLVHFIKHKEYSALQGALDFYLVRLMAKDVCDKSQLQGLGKASALVSLNVTVSTSSCHTPECMQVAVIVKHSLDESPTPKQAVDYALHCDDKRELEHFVQLAYSMSRNVSIEKGPKTLSVECFNTNNSDKTTNLPAKDQPELSETLLSNFQWPQSAVAIGQLIDNTCERLRNLDSATFSRNCDKYEYVLFQMQYTFIRAIPLCRDCKRATSLRLNLTAPYDPWLYRRYFCSENLRREIVSTSFEVANPVNAKSEIRTNSDDSIDIDFLTLDYRIFASKQSWAENISLFEKYFNNSALPVTNRIKNKVRWNVSGNSNITVHADLSYLCQNLISTLVSETLLQGSYVTMFAKIPFGRSPNTRGILLLAIHKRLSENVVADRDFFNPAASPEPPPILQENQDSVGIFLNWSNQNDTLKISSTEFETQSQKSSKLSFSEILLLPQRLKRSRRNSSDFAKSTDVESSGVAVSLDSLEVDSTETGSTFKTRTVNNTAYRPYDPFPVSKFRTTKMSLNTDKKHQTLAITQNNTKSIELSTKSYLSKTRGKSTTSQGDGRHATSSTLATQMETSSSARKVALFDDWNEGKNSETEKTLFDLFLLAMIVSALLIIIFAAWICLKVSERRMALSHHGNCNETYNLSEGDKQHSTKKGTVHTNTNTSEGESKDESETTQPQLYETKVAGLLRASLNVPFVKAKAAAAGAGRFRLYEMEKRGSAVQPVASKDSFEQMSQTHSSLEKIDEAAEEDVSDSEATNGKTPRASLKARLSAIRSGKNSQARGSSPRRLELRNVTSGVLVKGESSTSSNLTASFKKHEERKMSDSLRGNLSATETLSATASIPVSSSNRNKRLSNFSPRNSLIYDAPVTMGHSDRESKPNKSIRNTRTSTGKNFEETPDNRPACSASSSTSRNDEPDASQQNETRSSLRFTQELTPDAEVNESPSLEDVKVNDRSVSVCVQSRATISHLHQSESIDVEQDHRLSKKPAKFTIFSFYHGPEPD